MSSTEDTLNVTTTPESLFLQSSTEHDLLMAVIGILSFFSVIGTVGNAMVLYVYVNKRNKLASTVFIITLAGTDFITCVVIIPYTIVLEYMDYYVNYDFCCKFYMFLITSNVPFSAFIMMAIAVDRYLCICHPFTQILNKRMAKLVISGLAMVAFSLGIITGLNYGVYFKTVRNSTQSNDFSVTHNNSIGDEDGLAIPEGGHSYQYYMHNVTDDTQFKNSERSESVVEVLAYDGICRPDGLIFSNTFTDVYQKIYSSFFVIVIVVVVILYIMIYKFVSVRRAKRRRMRSQRSMYSSYKETATTYVNTRTSLNNGSVRTEVDMDSIVDEQPPRPKTEKTAFLRRMTIRERGLVANIRTAAMLFVVTAVFIIVFLPAWLMAHEVLPYNMLIFYMYFFYNVANPLIYAFMNKAFRRDLKDVIECRVSY